MSNPERTCFSFPWEQLTALYCAFTFIMLDIDMGLLHLGYRHNHFMTVMPIVFALIASLLSLFCAFSAWWRRQIWVVGVLTMLIGGVGTIIHLEIAFAATHPLTLPMLVERLVFDPRPPLAPAALAGTGLLLLFITAAERQWPVTALWRKCVYRKK